MSEKQNVRSLSDAELLRRLSSLVEQSRSVEADVVAHIAEFDQRRLYAREGAPSMFAYCTEVLHLSEQQACLRIAVARASRKPRGDGHGAHVARRPDSRTARGLRARRGSVYLRELRGQALRRAKRPGVPPRGALRPTR